jgi:hypothetical protein
MVPNLFVLAILITTVVCTGCGHLTYNQTKIGKFEGSLDVRWIKPDQFIYIPDKENPLRFTTANKKVIQPRKMYTDGGSIPRLFWGVPGYSPWGYAPSYVIHDWLFEAHHCGLSDYKDITFEDSATILAEGIKTLMESGKAPKEEIILWVIYEAVRTPIAKSLWDASDACHPVEEAAGVPGELILRIDLSSGTPIKRNR